VIKTINIKVKGQGLHQITGQIEEQVKQSQLKEGLCTLFIRHTSASLIIQENADPSACADLESWLNRLVPENDPLYTHTLEGLDDMPAHIKSVLTATSISIPVIDGQLALGVWQGIYLWEHRYASASREVIIHIGD